MKVYDGIMQGLNEALEYNRRKAILVIDMPSNCKECRFFQEVREEDPLGFCKDYKCFFGCSHVGCFIERPKDCPLRAAPEPELIWFEDADDWARGYNTCLDEIFGNGDEDDV